jgi:hypothetical protein
MPDLVKSGREYYGRQEWEEQARVIQRLSQRLSHADLEKDPPIGDDQSGEKNGNYGWKEQRPEDGTERSGNSLGNNSDPVPERKERIWSLWRSAGPVRLGHQVLWPELFLNQKVNVLAGKATLDRISHDGRNLGGRALAIDGLQNLIQERRKLQDLAV